MAAEGTLVVVLDLTEDVKPVEEGQVRDLNRALQDLRKKARLGYDERIVISVVCSPPLRRVLDQHLEWLREQVLATEITDSPLSDALITDEVDAGDDQVIISLRR